MRMRKRRQPVRPWLRKKAERGFHGYAIATIAFYGPKVAVSIILTENHEPDLLSADSPSPIVAWMCAMIPPSASTSWPSSRPTRSVHRSRRRHHRLPPRRRRGLSRSKVLSSVPLLGRALSLDQGANPLSGSRKKSVTDCHAPWCWPRLPRRSPARALVRLTICYVAILFVSTSVASVSRNRASRRIPLAGLYTSCGRQTGNFLV